MGGGGDPVPLLRCVMSLNELCERSQSAGSLGVPGTESPITIGAAMYTCTLAPEQTFRV